MQTVTDLKEVMSVKKKPYPLVNVLNSRLRMQKEAVKKGENKYQLSCYQSTE